jgi:hypothetical protein
MTHKPDRYNGRTLPFGFAGPGANLVLIAAARTIRVADLGGLLIRIVESAYTGMSRTKAPEASVTTRNPANHGRRFRDFCSCRHRFQPAFPYTAVT